ncbi:MAG: hypothetical protein HOO87_17130 [Methyloglobulus sp.]|nr:hypothetical protein [Methyloglobulus sp.]
MGNWLFYLDGVVAFRVFGFGLLQPCVFVVSIASLRLVCFWALRAAGSWVVLYGRVRLLGVRFY